MTKETVRSDGRRRRWPVARRFAATLTVLLVLAGVAGVIAAQTVPEFILFRERLVLNVLEIKSDIDLQPVDLRTHDGLTLRSWYHPPAEGKPVIVYFPGRDGDLIRKPAHLFRRAEEGYGLTLAGYRGYGGNPGRPSEWLLYRDATALLTKLTTEGLAPNGIVLYGYSMGTGVATYVATQARLRALILEAAFTSFPAAVHQQVPGLPLWLVRSRFDTRSRMPEIDVPILLLAGQNDTITPPDFAKTLAALSQGFSKLYVFPEANHINMVGHGALDAISGFLFGLAQAADAPAKPDVPVSQGMIPTAGTSGSLFPHTDPATAPRDGTLGDWNNITARNFERSLREDRKLPCPKAGEEPCDSRLSESGTTRLDRT